MDYEDCIDYIYNTKSKPETTSYETLEERYHKVQKKMNLVLDSMGYKQTFKVAHIAGTKGKGSTTLALSNLLVASNYNVGRILSPHTVDFRDRITINNKWIDKRDVVSITTTMKSIIENLNITLSAFQMMTIIALYYFYIKDVDYACIEVGCGGLLDSTNIVEPSVSIITSISFDHMNLLGNTLEEIASAKAGIIKNKIPCVSAFQKKNVASVLREVSKYKDSSIYFYKEDFDALVVNNDIDMLNFIYKEKDGCSLDIKTSLICDYQSENISLALFSYRILLGKKTNSHTNKILEQLKNIQFDGRFQIISKNPYIVLDCAHNAYSMECLLSNAIKYFDKKIILFYSPLKEKDIEGMCESIKRYESHIYKIMTASQVFFLTVS